MRMTTLLRYSDFKNTKAFFFLTKHLLNAFYEEPALKGKKLHKQIHVEAELYFDYENNTIKLALKIEEEKLYNLNNKLSSFAETFLGKEVFPFGKSFTYDPDAHYLSQEDDRSRQLRIQ